MEEERNSYTALVGKPEGRIPLGRPRRGWKDNVKMGLKELGWDSVEWIDQTQDKDTWQAVVNTLRNL
jgi:hypothetical protein